MTDFFKTFKIVDFRRDFLTLAKFRCASWSGSGDHVVCLFSKHSCSVHFCLMNLMMISQTAQCLSTDVKRGMKSENESLIFGIRK